MTLHGIALGKSAISGSLFCAVFRTVTKHDITKATLIGLVAIVLWSTMVGLIRGVSEGLDCRRRSHDLFIKRPAADFYRRIT